VATRSAGPPEGTKCPEAQRPAATAFPSPLVAGNLCPAGPQGPRGITRRVACSDEARRFSSAPLVPQGPAPGRRMRAGPRWLKRWFIGLISVTPWPAGTNAGRFLFAVHCGVGAQRMFVTWSTSVIRTLAIIGSRPGHGEDRARCRRRSSHHGRPYQARPVPGDNRKPTRARRRPGPKSATHRQRRTAVPGPSSSRR
jgi:hypothetical protein